MQCVRKACFVRLSSRVPVVWRVEVEQAEGPVRHGGGEQVCGQYAVEPGLGLRGPVPVKLDAVGLDGNRIGPVEASGQLRRRLSGPAAGIEDAQRLGVPLVVPGGWLDLSC